MSSQTLNISKVILYLPLVFDHAHSKKVFFLYSDRISCILMGTQRTAYRSALATSFHFLTQWGKEVGFCWQAVHKKEKKYQKRDGNVMKLYLKDL